MPASISTPKALEEGTYVIDCAFTDEDENPVTPKTLTWTLTDVAGNPINDREDEVVPSPSSTESILLQGDDLALLTGETKGTTRILTVEGTYDSALGNDLPIKGSVWFPLEEMAVV